MTNCPFETTIRAVIGGSRPPRFLSPTTWQQMLAAPPPPIPSRPSGAHFGMGWDVVQPTPAGVLYHKDGGVVGAMTWVEHDPAGVDWVLLFNQSKGKPEGPEVHQEFEREIRAAIAATAAWPDVDLFDRFCPAAVPLNAREVPLFGPSAIPVHNNGDMLGEFLKINLHRQT